MNSVEAFNSMFDEPIMRKKIDMMNLRNNLNIDKIILKEKIKSEKN